jgi:hypothetical protein
MGKKKKETNPFASDGITDHVKLVISNCERLIALPPCRDCVIDIGKKQRPGSREYAFCTVLSASDTLTDRHVIVKRNTLSKHGRTQLATQDAIPMEQVHFQGQGNF